MSTESEVLHRTSLERSLACLQPVEFRWWAAGDVFCFLFFVLVSVGVLGLVLQLGSKIGSLRLQQPGMALRFPLGWCVPGGGWLCWPPCLSEEHHRLYFSNSLPFDTKSSHL